MLSSKEIKEVSFSKAMGGYRQDEVEIFLDKIAADYLQYERIIKEYKTKIEEMKTAQSSIQNVLLSAQSLADSIVRDAKEKSEEIIHNAEKNIIVITEKEKELSAAFELKAQERKASLEKELSDMIKEAQLKAESINAATNDSVARQQMLFDKLKLEIAAFKSSVTAKYKEHLEILSHIPDTVPNDPKYLAQIVVANFEKFPEPEEFISKSPETVEAEEALVEDTVNEEASSQGFMVDETI